MKVIKERIFTFCLPLPLLLTDFLSVPKVKKERTANDNLQEVMYGCRHSRMDKMSCIFYKHSTDISKLPLPGLFFHTPARAVKRGS